MSPQKLAEHKAALLKRRAEVISEGPAKIEPNRTDSSTVGVADEDAQALSEMMQTLASQRNRQQAEILHQIDLALAKLERSPDDVGLCEECDEELDDRRLTLVPYATLCAECQKSRDPRRGQSRRGLTDYK